MKQQNYIIQYEDGEVDLDIHFFLEGKDIQINGAIDESACDVINLLDDEDVEKIKKACRDYLNNQSK